jgi:hypothetical protein
MCGWFGLDVQREWVWHGALSLLSDSDQLRGLLEVRATRPPGGYDREEEEGMNEGELWSDPDVEFGDVFGYERSQSFMRVAAETDKQALSVDDQLVYHHGLAGLTVSTVSWLKGRTSRRVFECHNHSWRLMLRLNHLRRLLGCSGVVVFWGGSGRQSPSLMSSCAHG